MRVKLGRSCRVRRACSSSATPPHWTWCYTTAPTYVTNHCTPPQQKQQQPANNKTMIWTALCRKPAIWLSTWRHRGCRRLCPC